MAAERGDAGCRDLKTAAVLFPVLLAAGFALYSSGLHAPAYYDSAFLLEKQPLFATHDPGNVVGIFPQRPLPMFSFYLNYLLGGMDRAYFRLVNVGLLALTALAVWRIVDLLLNLPGMWQSSSAAQRTWIGAGLSLLFLAHPYQVYVTLYIWQRMALMACLFGYWSLAIYLGVRAGTWRHRSLGYGLCLLFFVFASLSKENSVVLPGIFILAEIAFFRSRLREVAIRAAVYGAILVVLLVAMSQVERPHGTANQEAGIVAAVARYYLESEVTLWQVILTQCRVFFLYLSTIFLPSPESIQLIRPQALSQSLLRPVTTLSGLAGLLVFVGSGLYWLRRRPLVGFGMLFFFITIIPEGILVPQYAFFGYRAVFPLLGMALILADIALLLLRRREGEQRRGIVPVGLAVVWAVAMTVCAYTTVQKAQTWNHPVEFWQGMLAQFPKEKPLERIPATHVLFQLGIQQALHGDVAAAAETLGRAVKLSPEYDDARYNLGKALIQLGATEEAVMHLQKAVTLKPDYWQAHNTLGVALAQSGRTSEAVAHFRRAVELKPDDVPSRRNLDMALQELQSEQKGQEGKGR